MNDNDTQDEVLETRGNALDSGPGRRLREAREAKGMSATEVAAALNLHLTTITALEADDFGQLPEPIFIRGYLRNYGRLLGVPVEELLARYEEAAGNSPGPSSSLRPHAERDLPGDRGGVPGWVFALLLLLVVVVAGGWWLLQGSGDRSGVEAEGELGVSDGAEPPPGLPMPVAPEGTSELQLPAEPTATFVAGGEGAEAPEAPLPAEAEMATEAEMRAEPAEPEAAEPPSAPAPAAAAAPAPRPATRPAERLAGKTFRFRLTTTEDCWSDIRDANGRIFVGLARAGSEREFEGTAPVEMLLGNAAAAALEVNGKPYDLAPVSRGNVARVTLGGPEGDATQP